MADEKILEKLSEISTAERWNELVSELQLNKIETDKPEIKQIIDAADTKQVGSGSNLLIFCISKLNMLI